MCGEIARFELGVSECARWQKVCKQCVPQCFLATAALNQMNADVSQGWAPQT